MESMRKTALELLFDTRREHFDDVTVTIMDYMSEAIGGIDDFFNSLPIFEHTSIQWISVLFDKSSPEEEQLSIMGIISYNIGGTFTTSSGEVIPITEENAAYFTRPLRISLPIELMAANIRQDVTDYLVVRADGFGQTESEGEINMVAPSEGDGDDKSETKPPFPVGPTPPNLFPGELDEREQKRILFTAKNPEGKFH